MGSIGAGPPSATAASLAKPNVPIIAVMGGGTFGFHSAEIDQRSATNYPSC